MAHGAAAGARSTAWWPREPDSTYLGHPVYHLSTADVSSDGSEWVEAALEEDCGHPMVAPCTTPGGCEEHRAWYRLVSGARAPAGKHMQAASWPSASDTNWNWVRQADVEDCGGVLGFDCSAAGGCWHHRIWYDFTAGRRAHLGKLIPPAPWSRREAAQPHGGCTGGDAAMGQLNARQRMAIKQGLPTHLGLLLLS